MLYNALLLFLLFYYIYLLISLTNNKYIKFPYNSICSGFLDDVEYEVDKELCQLPCNSRNLFSIVNKNNNTFCGNTTVSVLLNETHIISKSNVTVLQHIVSNMSYLIYKKKVNV